MALLQCEMCCGELEISPDQSIGVCKYCGSTFTIPKKVEKKGNLFNRANYLRQSCNFDKAISVYESILEDDCEDASALWGLVLCRYGIEFVEDKKTGTRIPTCHRASRTSILLDPDFKSALKYADEEKRGVYVENAKKIDQIQKAILALSDSQEKYEVFICYKESDDSGERTIDSVLAQEIYQELTKLKIKTFFSRKTLEGKMGSSYEPIIYSALNSAKVMIVLGTKPEYFEATWVKNEWSRYLDFMNSDDDKHLIPVYKNMSAYQLPEEFVSIQALDMSRIGFMLDLCDGIKKLLRKEESVEPMGAMPVSKDSLYSRAMVFLGNKEFYKAVDYFDKALDIDPQYSRAYWGSLLASYRCSTSNELINCSSDDWTSDFKLHNALQFANEEERKMYQDAIDKRYKNLNKLASGLLEKRDFDKCLYWCEKKIENTRTDGGIWWIKLLAMHKSTNSNELFNYCLENSISLINSDEYNCALKYSGPEDSIMFENLVLKIEDAVKEKRKTEADEEFKHYMDNTIAEVSKKEADGIYEQYKHFSQEEVVFKKLKNYHAKLYRNNFFVFLTNCFLWALVAFGIAMAISTSSNNPSKDFITLYGRLIGIMMAVFLLISFIVYLCRAKRLPGLVKNCRVLEKKLQEDRYNVEQAKLMKVKLLVAKKAYLKSGDLSMEEIEERRHEFDEILEEYEKEE